MTKKKKSVTPFNLKVKVLYLNFAPLNKPNGFIYTTNSINKTISLPYVTSEGLFSMKGHQVNTDVQCNEAI